MQDCANCSSCNALESRLTALEAVVAALQAAQKNVKPVDDRPQVTRTLATTVEQQVVKASTKILVVIDCHTVKLSSSHIAMGANGGRGFVKQMLDQFYPVNKSLIPEGEGGVSKPTYVFMFLLPSNYIDVIFDGSAEGAHRFLEAMRGLVSVCLVDANHELGNRQSQMWATIGEYKQAHGISRCFIATGSNPPGSNIPYLRFIKVGLEWQKGLSDKYRCVMDYSINADGLLSLGQTTTVVAPDVSSLATSNESFKTAREDLIDLDQVSVASTSHPKEARQTFAASPKVVMASKNAQADRCFELLNLTLKELAIGDPARFHLAETVAITLHGKKGKAWNWAGFPKFKDFALEAVSRGIAEMGPPDGLTPTFRATLGRGKR